MFPVMLTDVGFRRGKVSRGVLVDHRHREVLQATAGFSTSKGRTTALTAFFEFQEALFPSVPNIILIPLGGAQGRFLLPLCSDRDSGRDVLADGERRAQRRQAVRTLEDFPNEGNA